MRYVGGKSRNARRIVDLIGPLGQNWREPFCGGLSMTRVLRPSVASDAARPLISLFTAMRDGWEPPNVVSPELYAEVRKQGEDAGPLYAFVGFCCSFGGKWWGGYARDGARNFALEGASSLRRKLEDIRSVRLACAPYAELDYPKGCAIYCDPPYRDTTFGYATGAFDHDLFWRWAAEMGAKGHPVFVSEFTAPDGVEQLAAFTTKTDLRKTGGKQAAVERVFAL